MGLKNKSHLTVGFLFAGAGDEIHLAILRMALLSSSFTNHFAFHARSWNSLGNSRSFESKSSATRNKKPTLRRVSCLLERETRFELATFSLEGRRSTN